MLFGHKVIPIDLSEEEISRIHESLDYVIGKLAPFLFNLSPKDRQRFSNLQRLSHNFINDTEGFLDHHPEFAPSFLSSEGFRKNLRSLKILKPFLNKFKDIESRLSDTILLTGDEAFNYARCFYQNAKSASEQSIPGAEEIYKTLSKRFEKSKSPKDSEPKDSEPKDSEPTEAEPQNQQTESEIQEAEPKVREAEPES